jgi:hypothetical protein
VILNGTGTGRDGCPCEHPRSHPDRWSDLLARHDQITGNLHGSVTGVEDRDGDVELITSEAEVFFQAVESGVGNGILIGLVLPVSVIVSRERKGTNHVVHAPDNRQDV